MTKSVSPVVAFERASDDFREELIYVSESNWNLEPRKAPPNLAALVRDALHAMAAYTATAVTLVDRAFTAATRGVQVFDFAELHAIAALAVDDDEADRCVSLLIMSLSSDERFRLVWAFVEPAFIFGMVSAYQALDGRETRDVRRQPKGIPAKTKSAAFDSAVAAVLEQADKTVPIFQHRPTGGQS